jgi:hypothetical protein
MVVFGTKMKKGKESHIEAGEIDFERIWLHEKEIWL